MQQQDIAAIFKEQKALLEGHFCLSSGLHSATYLQCARVLQSPKHAEIVCRALAEQCKKFEPTIVVGPALGGVIVAHETARALGLNGIFTERKDNEMTLRRGFSLTPEDRVLITEDVITTGRSTQEVVTVVNKTGARVVAVASLINRMAEPVDFGVPCVSLLNLTIPTFKPESCSLCQQGIPLVKPGSRKQ